MLLRRDEQSVCCRHAQLLSLTYDVLRACLTAELSHADMHATHSMFTGIAKPSRVAVICFCSEPEFTCPLGPHVFKAMVSSGQHGTDGKTLIKNTTSSGGNAAKENAPPSSGVWRLRTSGGNTTARLFLPIRLFFPIQV